MDFVKVNEIKFKWIYLEMAKITVAHFSHKKKSRAANVYVHLIINLSTFNFNYIIKFMHETENIHYRFYGSGVFFLHVFLFYDTR